MLEVGAGTCVHLIGVCLEEPPSAIPAFPSPREGPDLLVALTADGAFTAAQVRHFSQDGSLAKHGGRFNLRGRATP